MQIKGHPHLAILQQLLFILKEKLIITLQKDGKKRSSVSKSTL